MKLFIQRSDSTLVEVLSDLEQYDLDNSIAKAGLASEIREAILNDPDLTREYTEAN